MTSQQYADMNACFNSSVTVPASDGFNIIENTFIFSATASQGSQVVLSAPNLLYPVVIFVNLTQLPLSAFSVSSTTITFSPALNLNDQVTIIYYA